MAAKIKKGDKVIVLTGRDKGKTGEVTQVLPKEDRVVVSGVNVVKRHQRATQTAPGGIVEKNASIHVSNVALADPKSGEATRVGFKIEDGKKVRVAKKSGEVIDG
ncbi:50S ribosomal protein L24 [Oceanicaulis alexandrii]|jgi:large subunit ribosomal protein L24|uniref:50S ribosomal protein L24 n=1 Tax=Oceanicaulis TaxID=153232 RepID=UPI0003B67E17|nr:MULTISPECIES: 50S ribosomal protein L24 [Oceanicaulis]MAP48407.1 50S ribosomal protein L24 [Oceanicaulis sp.]MBL4538591.1 50S ribosomal protein L24 [Oceanicaulis sp.]VXC42194.1 50S ribosomal subunit protein L24 [Oceanicaulis sp. 350]HCR66003.1 50S ribosomal protein L24 [Oceanicaulis sp.]|tara:strand:- start:409 stop:723 length:315 start_codon:yes stop_codon:yes gene_type:complete